MKHTNPLKHLDKPHVTLWHDESVVKASPLAHNSVVTERTNVLTWCIDWLRLPLLFLAFIIAIYISFEDNNFGVVFLFIGLTVVGRVGVTIVPLHGDSVKSTARVFFIIFASAVIATCLIYLYYMLVNSTPYPYGWADDDYAFDNKALNIYQSDLMDIGAQRDNITKLGSGTWHASDNYSILLALLYRGMDFFGFAPHPLYPRMLNSLLLAGTAVMVHRLAFLCGLPLWGARFSAYLCGLFPYMLFAAGHTYRDILISFGAMTFMFAIAAILVATSPSHLVKSKLSPSDFILLTLGTVIVAYLRDGYLIALLLIAIVCIALSRMKRGVGLVITITFVLMSIMLSPLIISLFGFSVEDATSRLDYYHTRHADTTGNITGAVFRLPYIVSLPFRLMLRNVSPLPLPQELAPETYNRLGTLIWFICIPFLIRALIAAFQETTWERNQTLRIVACGFLVFYLLNVITSLQDRHLVIYIPMATVLIGSHVATAPRTMLKDILLMSALGSFLAILLAFKDVFLG